MSNRNDLFHSLKCSIADEEYFTTDEKILILKDIRVLLLGGLLDYQKLKENFSKELAFELRLQFGICYYFNTFLSLRALSDWRGKPGIYAEYVDAFETVVLKFFSTEFYYAYTNNDYAYPPPFDFDRDLYNHDVKNLDHFVYTPGIDSSNAVELCIEPRIVELTNALKEIEYFLNSKNLNDV